MLQKFFNLTIFTWLFISCGKEDLKTKFSGDWLRSDGGYSLSISVNEDGSAVAKYFNPRPVQVKSALFNKIGDEHKIHIEFDDVNYKGSHYTLGYNVEKDGLQGTYFQVAAGQTYDVSFKRK